ncbi:MAG: cation:proton antiporter [Burkholderiales bacterium]|nr:cation:proton antiporter [Burkholderiales bacterium]MBK8667018.1 cation:proton antiporter [Burkholderiales bacterium]
MSEITSFLANLVHDNLVLTFGLLLVVGALGGVLAARIRWLPTITGYMAIGLAMGPSGLGILNDQGLSQALVLVDIALGLILFKLGTALHPVKAWRTPGLVLTGVAESLITALVIGVLLWWLSGSLIVALLGGAIAVSSSPAVLIHVAHEFDAEGPTLDAAEMLVAINNVLSFLLFTLALPIALFGQGGTLLSAIEVPLVSMAGAVAFSVVTALIITRISRVTLVHEAHLRFPLVVGGVMLVLGLAQALNVSGLFGALTLGIATRWLEKRRSSLSNIEFGGGGDVFFITLFVVAGAKLHLHDLVQYWPVALAFVGARAAAKVVTVTSLGPLFGYPVKKSFAAGLLLVPMAGLAIGLLQTTSTLVPELGARMGAIVLAAVAIFETIGPPVAAWAIKFVGEDGAAKSAADS